MEELTLRLPAETKASLQSEADERGVTLGAHVRDIIDAYRTNREDRPTVRMEYVHRCQSGSELEELDAPSDSEEIGSFSYGSRSIIS